MSKDEKIDLSHVKGSQIDQCLDQLAQGRVGEHTRMRCKFCGYVYDPALGCEQWSIPPGTSFNDLPESFQCPECGHPKWAFLPDGDDWF